jgi:hypothetical protein
MVPLSSHIIVAEQHQASLLAGQCMSEREALAAAIAAVREAERLESKAQPDAVSELFRGELSAIEAIGRGGEPRPSLLGTEHPAAGCRVGRSQQLMEGAPAGSFLALLGTPALDACMASMRIRVEPDSLAQRLHEDAGAGLRCGEGARGRLHRVREAETGMADRDSCQLALALGLCCLQQSLST